MTRWASLTPEDVYAKAAYFRVDLAREPFLVALMKQAVITPLPPSWALVPPASSGPTATATATAAPRYRNELTGEIVDAHPADAYFVKQIHELRQHFGRRRPAKAAAATATAVEVDDVDDDGNEARPQERVNANDDDDDADAHGWMEFEDEAVQATYYFDFVTGRRQAQRPKVLLLRELPVGGGGSSTPWTQSPTPLTPSMPTPPADPRAFDGAAALHKRPSISDIAGLEILSFTSWWTESTLLEGPTRAHAEIYFSIPTRHFQVVLGATDNVFTISHVVHPTTGRVLGAWDLHVGARVPLLGRWTTLMQPSLLTRQWLAHHEAQWSRTKRELESQVRKYELRPGPRHRPFTGQLACAEPHKSAPGVSLRGLLRDVAELKARLAQYRPDLARHVTLPVDFEP